MPRGNLVLRIALVFCCAATAAGLADGANWPRFRGPNGTGIAADKDVPVKWDAKHGILWKVSLPGQGNSSPVVWGDNLFVQTSSEDGKERSLLCLSVRNGQVLWSRTARAGIAKTHPKNTLASSTPATDGERVYTAFWDGRNIQMVAYDLDGGQVWERNLGPFESQHGAGASPIVYRDKVYYIKDGDDLSMLVALDSKSGKTVWESARPFYRACYSAPLIRDLPGGGTELLVVSTKEVTGYNLDTGAKNWTWHWKFTAKMPLRTTASPILAGNMLIACSGDGGGDRHAVGVRLDSDGKATKATLVWENKKDMPYVPCPLALGDHIYFVNDKGVAGCYLAKTGDRIWYERLPGATFTASPVLIDGKIYAASEEGDVFVMAANPAFQLLARNGLGERMRATPAVADNRLFIRGQSHLYCIGRPKGQ